MLSDPRLWLAVAAAMPIGVILMTLARVDSERLRRVTIGAAVAMVAASIAVCGFEHGVRQLSALGLTGHRHPCLPA